MRESGTMESGSEKTSSLKKELTYRKYEDEQFVRAFSELRGTSPRPYERKLISQLIEETCRRRASLGLAPGEQVKLLDLGTGYGRDLAWLDQHPEFTAFGVDYSAAMLCLAQQHFPSVGERLAQMDLRSLGVRDDSVDVVRAQAVFHHLGPDDANLAMAEISRVIKPTGLLRIFVRHGSFDGLLEEPGLEPRYFHYYSGEELAALLERHGFKLLAQELIAPPDPRHLTFLAVLASPESH